jgi:tetratricopeptide (TPR) repeat protein
MQQDSQQQQERRTDFFDWPCGHCYTITAHATPMRCANCHMVSYCNKDCQRAHWKEHKKECTVLSQSRKAKNVNQVLVANAKSGTEIDQMMQKMSVLQARFHRQLDRGNLEKAEREARNIIQSWSEQGVRCLHAHADLAQVLYHQKKYDAAMVESRVAAGLDLERALYTFDKDDMDPKIQGFVFMGEIYRLRGEKSTMPRAVLAYQQALKCCPAGSQHAHIYQGLGEAYDAMDNHHDQAIDSFQRVLQLQPTDSEIAFRLAKIYVAKAEAFDRNTPSSFQEALQSLDSVERSLTTNLIPNVEKAVEYSALAQSLDATKPKHAILLSGSLEKLVEALQMLIATKLEKSKSGGPGSNSFSTETYVKVEVIPHMRKYQQYGARLLMVDPNNEELRAKLMQNSLIIQSLTGST